MSSNGDSLTDQLPSSATDLLDSSSDEEISAYQDFIAGGVAGSASVVVGHPFDTLKVRLQTSTTNASLLQLASTFGGAGSLFRGMGAPLSAAAVVNAIIFSSYGISSRLYDQYTPKKSNLPILNNGGFADDDNNDDGFENGMEEGDPWHKSFACGGFAGLVQCAVICPMEHIKCRLQVQHGKGSADNVYSGPIQATKSILKSYGVPGLFRGWWCTALREVPAFGLYFSSYDYIKDNVNSFLARQSVVAAEDTAVPIELQHSHAWLSSALAGGSSGCITWAAVYPVDVIKTRIQTSSLDSPVSFWVAGRQLVAKHGWPVMFRGLGVTLVRAFPVNGTIFPVYEFTLNQIKKKWSQ